MNTPLGVQGKAHQDRRDRHEKRFNETYGIKSAATPEAKASCASKGSNRLKFIEERQKAARRASRVLEASGRNPAFA